MSKQTEQLKKLVGSLLIVGFEGTCLTASCHNYLDQWDLGGVILFKRNIESFEQVAELNTKIYEAAQLTPIVSVDHEGGKVFRLPEPFTVFPAMGKLLGQGTEQAVELAEQVGEAFGRELRAAGFNLDWAPVLDVNSNPENPIIGERAFSNDPEIAAQIALAFLDGLQETGVLGCGKHFPGHGDTHEDSHKTLPVVDKTEEEIFNCEMIPFRQAVARQVPLMMTAHVLYPALDEEWPATLSEKILKGILRDQLAFEGLIVSDDMFMKGITDQWALEEASERFLRAGGDMLLLCHKESRQRRVAAHLVHAAEKDPEFRDLLEQKAKRVQLLRGKLAQGARPDLLAQYRDSHQKLAGSFT